MKQVLLVAPPAMLFMLGLSVLFPVLPFFVRDLGLSETQAGVLFAVYAAMSVAFSPLWGRFSERRGRKSAMIIGLLGFALGFLLFAFGESFVELLAARVLGGALAAATMPAIFAFAADVSSGETRSAAMGIVGAAIGLGVVVGPIIGGLLGEIDLRAPFLCPAACASAAAAYVALVIEEPAAHATRNGNSSFRMLLSRLSGILVFIFVISTARVGFESTIAFALADLVGAGPRQVGLLLGGMGVVGVLVQGALIRPIVRLLGDYRTLLAGTALLSLGLVAVSRATDIAWFGVAGAVLAIGYGLSTPTFTALVSKLGATSQGRSQGLGMSAQSLGRVVGPVLFTAIYQIWGGGATFAAAALLAACGLGVAAIWVRPT